MSFRIKWNECDEAMAHQLSGVTFSPGKVYPYPIDALQESIQQSMPGLREAFVSGYLKLQATSDPTLSGLGEFAVIREENGKTKSYNFIFAKNSDGKLYFAGPFKDFQEHHLSGGVSVPIAALFGIKSFKP